MRKRKITKVKASILIVSLWVLVILTILAVSIANRAIINLQLVKYQRDTAKAYCIARIGIFAAQEEIDKKQSVFDASVESWANNPKAFESVKLDDRDKDYAVISYLDENNQVVYGVRDEERKININTASLELLTQVFVTKGLPDAQLLAATVLEWRNAQQEPEPEKKVFKNAFFTVIEEFMQVLEFVYKDKDRARDAFFLVRDVISVNAESTLNVNTCTRDVLNMLVSSCATDQQKDSVPKIVDRIIALRDSKKYFTSVGEIVIDMTGINEGLFNTVIGSLSCKSRNFLLQVTGISQNSKVTIEAVYDRKKSKFVQWRQR